MYFLRAPMVKNCICRVIPSSRPNFTSPVACPLCRRSQISSPVVQTARQQSTSTKTSLVGPQLKKKKKKSQTEGYSELIEVEEASGNSIKQSRPVVKTSTMKEILSSLSATSHKQHNLETAKSPKPLKSLQSAGHSPPTSRTDAAKTATKLSKKTASLQKDSTAKSANPESMKERVAVSNFIRAKLDNVAGVDDLKFAEYPSCDIVENISNAGLEPSWQGINDNRIFFPGHSEVEELQEVISPKNEELTEKVSLPKTRTSLKVQEREKAAKIKKAELKRSGNDVYLNISLSAFLDVCVNSDMLDLAHSTLMNYRTRGLLIKNNPKITDIRLFNAVIDGHAKKGNWGRVREILAVIQYDKVKPNLQTYVGCLECLSRRSTKEKTAIRFVLQDATKHGLDIANLDHECTFVNDQRERVIEAVRLVCPDFQPTPRGILKRCSSSLLSRLNEAPPEDRFHDPLGGTMTYEQLLANLRSQIETELSDNVTVRSVERLAHENLEKTRSVLRECEDNWRAALLRGYNENIEIMNSRQRSKHRKSISLLPFLTTLDAKSYVDIMLGEIRSLGESSEAFSLPLATLHILVGSKVMNSYMITMKQKQGLVSKVESLYQKYCEYYVNPKLTSRFTPREYWQKITNENVDGPSTDIEIKTWPVFITAGVGKFLYDIIIREVKINTNFLKPEGAQGLQIPAFYNIYRNKGVVNIEEIKPHPILMQMYRLETKETLSFEGSIVPSLVPPRPWTSIRSGGNLLSSVKAIRIMDATTHKRRLGEAPNPQLYPIFDSLNCLGECPWKINKPILDIIIDIFNNKGDEALAIPPPLTECPQLPSLTPDLSKKERAAVYQERILLHKKRTEMLSLRCDSIYKLSIANHFRDKIFWFPHNMDFRGRVYPCPPHFNHLGSDMTRGILLFAKGEPLGEKGLEWLKIHLINLTGFKKQEAIGKRLEFANKMMPEIIDSADNPLNGRKWWTTSDGPWQTLACCKEITNAVRSPDPVKYVCHFPVHQDGSCNGLQHYAALGRDEEGAKQVNLYPMDKPGDVYSGVADLVEKARAQDAENGVEIAKALEGFVKRRVVKQTVMTTVYGVTRYGAFIQMKKQLKDLADFPKEHVWAASLYLTEKTFESLQQMFTATKEIQDWLTDVAEQVSRVCGQPVEWVTPLGLPIVQPYRRTTRSMTSKGLLVDENQKREHLKLEIYLQPNVQKQKNAFPANFIHSLDSSHMMLTSLFCQREGITFVSVHDCFWTHASKSVEIMNKICREQFVALHSEPILENLSKFLSQKYQYSYNQDKFGNDLAMRRLNKLIVSVPVKGNFNLNNVLQSTYFFS